MYSYNYDALGCCSTTVTYSSNAWIQWNQSITYTTSSSVVTGPWVIWNYAPATSMEYPSVALQAIAEQEQQRRQAMEEERQRIHLIRDKAKRRAEDLLFQFLNEEQEKQYRKDRYFEVTGPDSKQTYRIHHGWSGNIRVFNERGKLIESLCIHPRVNMPEEDNLLAQKLLLESNEAEFRRIANITKIAA